MINLFTSALSCHSIHIVLLAVFFSYHPSFISRQKLQADLSTILLVFRETVSRLLI